MDIIQRLRDRAFAFKAPDPLCEEAADEIARLRLTDAEREAVERGYCSLMGVEDMSAECTRWDAEAAATLRGLLERTASA